MDDGAGSTARDAATSTLDSDSFDSPSDSGDDPWFGCPELHWTRSRASAAPWYPHSSLAPATALFVVSDHQIAVDDGLAIYDVTTDTYTLSDVPAVTGAATATLLAGGTKALIAGGSDADGFGMSSVATRERHIFAAHVHAGLAAGDHRAAVRW